MLDINIMEKILTYGINGLLFITLTVFVVYSLGLVYHWMAYGIHKTRITIMFVIYFSVSAILFISMLTALISL